MSSKEKFTLASPKAPISEAFTLSLRFNSGGPLGEARVFLNGSLVLAASEAAAGAVSSAPLPLASQRLYPLVVEAADRTGGAVLI
jgi:hypothetical protein